MTLIGHWRSSDVMKLDRPVLRPPHCYLTRAAYEVGTLYDDTTILTSYTNEGQSNLTKSDIAWCITTSATAHSSVVVNPGHWNNRTNSAPEILSITSSIFVRRRKVDPVCAFGTHILVEGEVVGISDATIRKNDGGFLQGAPKTANP